MCLLISPFDRVRTSRAPVQSEVVACPRCILRAEQPQVSTCVRTDCPMARSLEAVAA